MGLFKKITQAAGFDGVSIAIDAPTVVQPDTPVINGIATIICSSPQTFKWIRVEFQSRLYRESEGYANGEQPDSWKGVSKWELKEPFSLGAAESREIPFELAVRKSEATNPAAGVLGKMGMFGSILNSMTPEMIYQIEVKANVDGVAFDPTEHVDIVLS